MKDRVQSDIGAKSKLQDWSSIDWKTTEKRVRNLRQRIFRATKNKQWNRVKSLTKLLLRSYSNLLLCVNKVTQKNKGKATPGVDNQIVLTPKARVRLVHQMLKHHAWAVNPGRRLYIPKADGKQRPLGILTIKNRVAQAIVKNALEPCWEARFEANSYGFRPGRGCHDAVSQCWNRLRLRKGDCWVLDADVRAAFDNISHCFILKRLGYMPGRELIKQWLRAGYVEAEIFHATANGVQQGGVISPLIANVALDGLGEILGSRFGYIRYADDFIVTGKSKEQIEALVPKVKDFLAERGLELNAEKTRIVHVDDGFNFLGFTVRRFHNKCIVTPQKEKVLAFLRRIRDWLKQHICASPANVIRHLNRLLIGWGNYYRHFCSKRTFITVDTHIWRAIWKWCLRRHPKKSKAWIYRKYFKTVNGRSWSLFAKVPSSKGGTKDIVLFNLSSIPIKYHVKVAGAASPDDPELSQYWRDRRRKRKRATGSSAVHVAVPS